MRTFRLCTAYSFAGAGVRLRQAFPDRDKERRIVLPPATVRVEELPTAG